MGGSLSADTVRRLAEGFGDAVETHRATKAEQANAVARREEGPSARRVAVDDAVGAQGNVSTHSLVVTGNTGIKVDRCESHWRRQ